MASVTTEHQLLPTENSNNQLHLHPHPHSHSHSQFRPASQSVRHSGAHTEKADICTNGIATSYPSYLSVGANRSPASPTTISSSRDSATTTGNTSPASLRSWSAVANSQSLPNINSETIDVRSVLQPTHPSSPACLSSPSALALGGNSHSVDTINKFNLLELNYPTSSYAASFGSTSTTMGTANLIRTHHNSNSAVSSPRINQISAPCFSPTAPRSMASHNWRQDASRRLQPSHLPASSTTTTMKHGVYVSPPESPPGLIGSSNNNAKTQIDYHNSQDVGSQDRFYHNGNNKMHNTASVLQGLDPSTFWAYYLDRGDGTVTRLIPADMLPPMRDIPAREHWAGAQEGRVAVLPMPTACPPEGLKSSNTEKVAFMVHQHAGQQQSRRPKIYCDKWVHEGVCAFTQQGCKYKHEMPLDKATQHQLGLFHGFPAWWKKHQADIARAMVPPPPGMMTPFPSSAPIVPASSRLLGPGPTNYYSNGGLYGSGTGSSKYMLLEQAPRNRHDRILGADQPMAKMCHEGLHDGNGSTTGFNGDIVSFSYGSNHTNMGGFPALSSMTPDGMGLGRNWCTPAHGVAQRNNTHARQISSPFGPIAPPACPPRSIISPSSSMMATWVDPSPAQYNGLYHANNTGSRAGISDTTNLYSSDTNMSHNHNKSSPSGDDGKK